MKSLGRTSAFLSAQMSLAMALPLLAAAAEQPSTVNSQPAAPKVEEQSASSPYGSAGPGAGGTGIYDNFDRFKDEKGFPRPGYGLLFGPAD